MSRSRRSIRASRPGARTRPARGASLVEASIASLMFFTVLLGLFEFGWAFRDYMTTADMARNGARAGSSAGNSGTADYTILQAVKKSNGALNSGQLQYVVVYDAGSATGTLATVPPPVWRDGTAVEVVMASAGYPESASKGDVIHGLVDAEQLDGVHVIHAGTAMVERAVVTAGGRVLAVVGTGASLAEARDAAYDGVAAIEFDGAQHRTDIALAASRG